MALPVAHASDGNADVGVAALVGVQAIDGFGFPVCEAALDLRGPAA